MPRPRMRLAGIVVPAFLLAGCSGIGTPRVETPPPAPTATPSPTPSQVARWEQQLDFSGELSGTMNAVVPVNPTTRSECTGPNSKTAGAGASSLFGFVGTEVYGVLFTVSQYRGPGSYSAPQFSVQVHRLDNAGVWQTPGGGPAPRSLRRGARPPGTHPQPTGPATGRRSSSATPGPAGPDRAPGGSSAVGP